MTELLGMIYGELFPQEIRQLALDILYKQQFNVRISRFLPLGVKVAHKTGTIGGIRNDCGIISVGDSNHVILSLFTEWDEAPLLEPAGGASSAGIRSRDGDGRDRPRCL